MRIDRKEMKRAARLSMRDHKPSVYLITLVFLVIMAVLEVLSTKLQFPGMKLTEILQYQMTGEGLDRLKSAVGQRSFLGTALMLLAAEIARYNVKRTRGLNDMKWYHAVIIGALQGVAVLPGVSRSGSTITGAFFCGIKKKPAAEFSFLLSIPAILGGAVLELPDIVKGELGDFTWYGTLIAMAVAGVSGYFAIRFMLKLITKKNFDGFIIYTASLGLFLILNQFVLHLF